MSDETFEVETVRRLLEELDPDVVLDLILYALALAVPRASEEAKLRMFISLGELEMLFASLDSDDKKPTTLN